MNIRDEVAADAAEIIAEIGEVVTWKGTDYPALVSDPTMGEDLNLGGFVSSGDFTIKIMRSSLGSAVPQLGDILEYEGGKYRVVRSTNHARYPMVVLVVSSED